MELNWLCCLGCVCCYIGVVLQGIDERKVGNQSVLNSLCKSYFWMYGIGSTLVFLPLFCKTFRIGSIIRSAWRKSLKQVVIRTEKLLIAIGAAVVVDVSILIIFSVGVRNNDDELHYGREKGPQKEVDVLRIIQYKYGVVCCLCILY